MLRRTLLSVLAALLIAGPAFADPGDGRHWRDRQGGGPGPNWANGDGQNNQNQNDDRQRGGQDGNGRGGWRGGGDNGARHVRPLGEVIGELQGRYGGRLLGQELVNDGSRNIYRIRWMTADGRRLDLTVDADGR